MSRSNYDKPFYVDVGTSIVAVRCASNHDIVFEYDHSKHPSIIELAETACDRMNKEAEIGRPLRNCDRFSTWEEANKAFEKENAHRIGFMNLYADVLKWLFAPATEKEGSAK